MTSGLIRIILLAVLAAIGIPLNIASFIISARQCRQTPSRTLLVQIQRSIIDFLFITIYVSTQIYMNVSDYWTFGEPVCKAAYFMRHFCFSLSSNMIVCIAIDRFTSVQNMTQVRAFRPVKGMVIMLGCAWALSFLIALPTIFVRRTVTIFGRFTYCTFFWVRNETNLFKYIDDPPIYEKIWTFYDIFSKFWIPLAIVFAIYAKISIKLRQRLKGFSAWANAHPAQKTTTVSVDKVQSAIQPSCYSALYNVKDEPSCSIQPVMTKRLSEPAVQVHKCCSPGIRGNMTARARRVLDPIRRPTLVPSTARKPSMVTQWKGVKLMRGGMYLALIIIGVHTLFCLPYSLLSLVMAFKRQSYLESSLTYFDLLLIAGSVVNPIVYRNCLR